jgi:hypothetical protein
MFPNQLVAFKVEHIVSTNTIIRWHMKYTQVCTCKLACVLMNNTKLCDKAWQWLAAGLWFSPGIPVSSFNKTDRHFLGVGAVCFALQARHIFSRETNVRLLFFMHTKSVLFSSNILKMTGSWTWLFFSY